jgi:hypothetical protein
LGDCTGFANLSTLATLDAGHGLCAGTLGNNLNAGQILMELLVKSGGAGTNTFQTCHALNIFLNSQLLHSESYLSSLIFLAIIQDTDKNSNGKFKILKKFP